MLLKNLFVQAAVCSLILAGHAHAFAPPYGAILADAKKAHSKVGSHQGDCDYSHASASGGWGWNDATKTSCPPRQEQGYCDFSQANQNNGWGWNSVTQQSCR